MKKRFSILVVSTVIVGITLGLVEMALVSQAAPEPPVARKIVVFQSGVDEPAKEALLKNFGGEKIKDLPLVNGMAVLLSPQAERALVKQAGVLRVDNDDVVFALGKPAPAPQPDEMMAWGVNRIDADHVWAETWDQTTLPITRTDANTGQGIKVAIIDSGIDLDHRDLHVVGGYNAINSRKSYNDDYRHGTHVAGIVAALDSEIGVIGTAPKVELYAVKVLNSRGIGFASDIIDGLQWSIDHGIQVANMSIGSSGSSQSYHDAITAAYNAGITIVAAAGNNGETDGSIVWPARWPETIAVSATNINDQLAYFSSYASDVNQAIEVNLIAAPGENINSTWNDGYYHLGSGTSMATPHVTGVVALVLRARGCTSEDRLAIGCVPNEIISLLKTNGVEDLGLEGIDVYFGYGLIDAEKAVNSVTQ